MPRKVPARSRPSFRESEDDIEVDETIEDDDDDDFTFIADETKKATRTSPTSSR